MAVGWDELRESQRFKSIVAPQGRACWDSLRLSPAYKVLYVIKMLSGENQR